MIKDEIQKNILVSLKESRETEKKVLRFVLSQINYEEIAKRKDLTDEEIITLMQKEVKKRKEAVELFKKGKREDLVTDEEAQIQVIQAYLPKELTSEELEKIIDEELAKDSDHSNPGKIIGRVMGRVKGKASGTSVSKLIQEKLTKSA